MTEEMKSASTILSISEGIQILISRHPDIGLDALYFDAVQSLESARLLLANGDVTGACVMAIKSTLSTYRAAYEISLRVHLIDAEDTAKSLINSAATCLGLVKAEQAPEDETATIIR